MERKLATVVFVDIVSSTELVADADPEVVRRRVIRFFDEVSHCIITHGGPGEILVGPGTARLARDRVELEPVAPLDLRGWREPITAYHVVCAVELGAPLRTLAAP